MKTACLAAVALSLVAGGIVPASVLAEPPIAELLKLHVREAASYQIFQDEKHTRPLELNTKPVFNWTNVAGGETQIGHLFVWTHAGRPEVIGTMFSTRDGVNPTKRKLIHEFHTLATRQLFPITPDNSQYQWTPATGISFVECREAPPVAGTASQRLAQIRNVARSFVAENRTRAGQTWELRLLPTPLLRYESTAGEVLDGALFAMVSSEGTDPEVLLMIEARHADDDEKAWTWHAAALRFSDKDLAVKRNDKPLWSSYDDDSRRVQINADYTLMQTKDKTYTCYRARLVDELPDAVP